jgi:hypothetical protein
VRSSWNEIYSTENSMAGGSIFSQLTMSRIMRVHSEIRFVKSLTASRHILNSRISWLSMTGRVSRASGLRQLPQVYVAGTFLVFLYSNYPKALMMARKMDMGGRTVVKPQQAGCGSINKNSPGRAVSSFTMRQRGINIPWRGFAGHCDAIMERKKRRRGKFPQKNQQTRKKERRKKIGIKQSMPMMLIRRSKHLLTVSASL